MNRMIPLTMTLLLLTVCPAADQSPSKSEDSGQTPATRLTPLMHMKLEKSKTILEGLALEDFDKIRSGARSLRLLSTESGWNVIQTQEYADQSRAFQRSAALIAEAAEEKDIHRAAMGYVALTVCCVECHSYMRKHRVVPKKSDTE